MVINLENVFRNDGEAIGLDSTFDFSEIEVSGLYPVSNAKITGEIRNRTGIVSIDAVISYSYCAVCDRCACDVRRDFSVKLCRGVAFELNDEDNDDYIIAENMRLDLDELALTEVLLSLPTKFLCKEDCKGICPQCGKNLNDGSCSCAAPTDPRLDVLRQLLDK